MADRASAALRLCISLLEVCVVSGFPDVQRSFDYLTVSCAVKMGLPTRCARSIVLICGMNECAGVLILPTVELVEFCVIL